MPLELRFVPVTPEHWSDLVALFGVRGGCGGCWCMLWRRTPSAFNKGKTGSNRAALRRLVNAGKAPGVLAYAGSLPVGWCAIAPRDSYPRLGKSRVLRPVDGTPVWCVSCLFVHRQFRRQGVSTALLRAAARFAFERGATVVEGYPVVPYSTSMPAAFAWTGTLESFRSAGFVEVARRSATRPIMRRYSQ